MASRRQQQKQQPKRHRSGQQQREQGGWSRMVQADASQGQAAALAALLLRKLEAKHAGGEHYERLEDAIGVWTDHQEQH